MIHLLKEDGNLYVLFSHEEAVQSQSRSKWIAAVNDELQSLQHNQVWKLMPLSPGGKTIPVCWTSDVRENADSSVSQSKVQLVGKEYTQIEGVDFAEVYLLMSKYATVRILMVLMTAHGRSRMSPDIKTGFLKASLVYAMYVQQACGYVHVGREPHLYLLTKALQVLKQTERLYYQIFPKLLNPNGF